jgi:regulator-associated protein of mTOR
LNPINFFERVRLKEDIEHIISRDPIHLNPKFPRIAAVGLCLCLNIHIDPKNGMQRPSPADHVEAWVKPFEYEDHQRGTHEIGQRLMDNYRGMGSLRSPQTVPYKFCTNPSLDKVKKFAQHLRGKSKSNRVLFHFNGHGVPRASHNGELWVFNPRLTEYIPMHWELLVEWIGDPFVLVLDYSGAGIILEDIARAAVVAASQDPHHHHHHHEGGGGGGGADAIHRCPRIVFAACGPRESLPVLPGFPLDIFTACLTTPIRMALVWFEQQNSWAQQRHPHNYEKILKGMYYKTINNNK